MPFESAPELFAWMPNEYEGCYVKRQPANPGEVTQMILAMSSAEVDCIRYAGSDAELQRRILTVTEGLIDHPVDGVSKGAALTRLSVTANSDVGPKQLIAALKSQLKRDNAAGRTYREAHSLLGGDARSLRFAWADAQFHLVQADVDKREPGRLALRLRPYAPDHAMHLGLNLVVERWLRADGRFSDFRWWTDEAWRRGEGWRPEAL